MERDEYTYSHTLGSEARCRAIAIHTSFKVGPSYQATYAALVHSILEAD